jgi:phosphoribosylaminoimidazole-succinocarboxamide synthase
MADVVLETDLPYSKFKKGKVREVYDLEDRLLIVASDRISAFDVVLPNGIPDKGRVLTQLSLYWFDKVSDIIGNHVITADVSEYPQDLKKHKKILEERSMLVKKSGSDSRRMHSPRLSLRLRMEGVPEKRDSVRDNTPERP